MFSRSELTVNSLAKHMEDHTFFKQRGLQSQVLVDVLSRMELVKMAPADVVFEIDSVGDKFYFILQGNVEVQIPDPQRRKQYNSVSQSIFTQQEIINSIE